ncbi:hypothetical protein CYR55_02575 [Chimaeribacter californicus]|uniref:Uncharacterized protein n=1 Tax=Chimaeribacter californicus TaxID=2060067 RepID=A0A2N5EGR6_9GAMM|nr:hypothetical protein [Chimaeribacter californicus]PLR41728.1 hypothetical protein CYR55_02575 [Chimaeribacter californicus]
MFEFLKRRQEIPAPTPQNTQEADKITENIIRLESQLSATPEDRDIQKTLMLEYNRALKVYAANTRQRDQVDTLFVKMDALRNIIRKTL